MYGVNSFHYRGRSFIVEHILKSGFIINKPLVVIPVKAGIQYFQDLLDARLRPAGMTINTTSF